MIILEACDVLCRFKRRRTLVKRMCSSKFGAPPSLKQKTTLFQNLIVDDEHRYIYCPVPKASSSSMKSVLLVLMGKENSVINVRHPHSHRRYKHLSDFVEEEQKEWRLRTYTKFMIHREPMTRLISAYIDKFAVFNKPYHRVYGRKIISKYRPGASNVSISTGFDVKFEEFVRFVVDVGSRSLDSLDRHWSPASSCCHPCYIDYDYYSSTDTLDEDIVSILRAIGAPDSLYLPHAHARHLAVNITHYYSHVPILSASNLLKLYSEDFRLFGYDVPDVDLLTGQ